MSNPLYNALGSVQNANMNNLIKQFKQFRRTFNGDPKQQVQNLLNSGKVSQDQYNQAVQIATAMSKMIK